MHPRLRNLLARPQLTKSFPIWALLALGAGPAAAGPEGGTVVGGAATIQGQGGPAVIVNQSTNSAIINWNTFNIRANESVRFNQPSASSVALNRVTGGLGPSEIMGSLTANGRVFIINRDGILFGPGSVVNTAGFLATTNDIANRRLHGRDGTISTSRAGRMHRSSTRERSRRRAAALPRWSRPACAIPAPSPRPSAPWRWHPATASRSTCTATS